MHLTYEDLILDFIDCSDIFDHMVLRPLSHIRGNWELQWNYEKLEFLEEEDSFAKDLNQLLRDITDCELPCNYRYHASEDIIARLVKKHLHWNIYRDRKAFYVALSRRRKIKRPAIHVRNYPVGRRVWKAVSMMSIRSENSVSADSI